MTLKIPNLAESTLAEDISTLSTTLELASAVDFGTLDENEWFPIAIVHPTEDTVEICRCTGLNADQLVIQRGREGTVAADFPSGSVVYMAMTSLAFAEFARSGDEGITLIQGLNYAESTGTGNALVVAIDNVASYVDGLKLNVRASANNSSGTPTINVNELGAVTIKLGNDTALDSGSIQKGQVLNLDYSTEFAAFVLSNPTFIADTVPTASTSVAGLAKRGTDTDHDIEGDNVSFTTQQTVSKIIDDYESGQGVNNLPFTWRNLGNGERGNLIVGGNESATLSAGSLYQFKSVSVVSGGTLNINRGGVCVILVQEEFELNGILNFTHRNNAGFPTIAVGPTGSVHSGTSESSDPVLLPQLGPGDFYNGGLDVLYNSNPGKRLSLNQFQQAIFGGTDMQCFSGGAGATYRPHVVGYAGGGVIILAREATFGSTARIDGMYARPEDDGAADSWGPGGGGMLTVGTLDGFTRSNNVVYEAGAESVTDTENHETATVWDASVVQAVPNAANGQFFTLNLGTGQAARVF